MRARITTIASDLAGGWTFKHPGPERKRDLEPETERGSAR